MEQIYACPQCGGDHLMAPYAQYGTTYLDGSGQMVDDRPDYTEFTEDGWRCCDCGHEGEMDEFTVEKEG